MERPGFSRKAQHAAMAVLAVAAIAIHGPAARAVPANEAPVYAIDDYPFQKAPALKRWRSVLEREGHLADVANPDECQAGEPRLACAAKEALLLEEKLKEKSPTEQVAAVYGYFNAIQWKEHDPASCGVDCWKSRLEFLAKREGDCGDHAIAEYFTLRRLGFKERDLQLIVAQLPGFADSFKGGHVVLRVRAEGEYFILDNRRKALVGLEGLQKYKVLAGMNAASVQIYNLVTDAPPAGFVADTDQVAQLIASPGAKPAAAVQVAEAPEDDTPAPAPVKPASFSTQSKATQTAEAEGGDDMMCMQSAHLADWNPFLPCTPVKVEKMVVKAKTIIGAKPNAAVQVAEAAPASEPKAAPKFDANALVKLPEPKPATKPVAPAPAPQANDNVDACMQGAARLVDWNPNLPCTSDGNASSLRIEFKDAP